MVLISPVALGRDGPLSPREALERFEVEAGLRIELVACEPQVVDPVAVAFDERGRMYVVEMRDYPADPGRAIGRVAVLEDLDRDGRYEVRHEFAEGLVSPNGVAVWNGGIFVTCAPDVLYLKDTNGDLRADRRKVVFTGFSLGDSSQLRVNHPTPGPDNWMYLANGLSGGSIVSPQNPHRSPMKLGRNDFRFRPGTDQYETVGGFAQFGLTFDDYGRRFICSNRRHCDQVVLEPAYLQRNAHLPFTDTIADISDHGAAARVYAISRAVTTAAFHAGTFTAACGITVYRGSALGPGYLGNIFTCEPTGNLVHRDVLGPGGAAMVATRAADKTEFLRSSDDWFRPVSLANGPDGALYVCDMYRKTIEHPRYLAEEIRKITDFVSGNDRGRIWRVTRAEARGEWNAFDSLQAGVEELTRQLGAKDSWWRETAQRLLIERGDRTAADFVRVVLTESDFPPGRVHALWTLDGLGVLEDSDVLRGLEDGEAGVRENAMRLAEPRLERSHDLREKALALAADADPRVRFQTALSLGQLKDASIIAPLVAIGWRDLADRYTRAAVLSSCGGMVSTFLTAFLSHPSLALPDEREGLITMVRLAATTMGAGEPVEACVSTLSEILGEPAEGLWRLALVRGSIDGLRRSGRLEAGGDAVAELARRVEPHSPAASEALRRLVDLARAVAVDGQASLEARAEASGVLAYVGDAVSVEVLRGLLSAQEPAPIQMAAVQALTLGLDETRLNLLLAAEAWEGYLPPVREVIIAAVMSRPKLVPRLFAGVESGVVPPSAFTPAQREQLTKHTNPAIGERAKKLFARVGGGDRRKAYEESLAALALPARAAHGRAVFVRLCSQCHQMEGEGSAVGPDLTGMRSQSPETLLLHVVIPEQEITPGYTNHIVETTDGQLLTGLLTAETPTSVTLRQAQGQEETVLRSTIAQMYAASLSMMPQELEKNMTAQELADLIAYLRGGEAASRPSTRSTGEE